MEVRGQRVMVIGWGVTGRALAGFLSARGARVVVAEQRMDIEAEQLPPGVLLHRGPEQGHWLDGVDLVVPSPGVARSNRLLEEATRRGRPIVSEIELAARFLPEITVAITGTNGKSTVTTLLGEIFAAAGRKPFVGGNLGTPLIAAVDGNWDGAIVEVSSFQLEWVEELRPRVGVYLNLSEDHLDRYRDLAEYGATKARLFANQRADDWAVLNRDDPAVWALAQSLPARVLGIGLERPANGSGLWPVDGGIEYALDQSRHGVLRFDAARRPGRHHLVNAMAAAGAALAAGIEAEPIERALAEFKGLPHRLELVHERGGIKFVDDSKATNVGAVVEALRALAPPLIVLAGGTDKGGDYAPLRPLLAERVKALILFGAAREKMNRELAGATRCEVRSNLEQAMQCAWSLARAGDTILLSPACSSFDQFRNYAERGRRFKELAGAL